MTKEARESLEQSIRDFEYKQLFNEGRPEVHNYGIKLNEYTYMLVPYDMAICKEGKYIYYN